MGPLISVRNLFAGCVVTFEDTHNKGVGDTGFFPGDEDTLAACQRRCLRVRPYCNAVDYKNGKCILFEEIVKLIDNVGNIHSVLKECNRR